MELSTVSAEVTRSSTSMACETVAHGVISSIGRCVLWVGSSSTVLSVDPNPIDQVTTVRRGVPFRTRIQVINVHRIWVARRLVSMTWEGDCSLCLVGAGGWSVLEAWERSSFLLWVRCWYWHILGTRGTVFLWCCYPRFVVGGGVEGFVRLFLAL